MFASNALLLAIAGLAAAQSATPVPLPTPIPQPIKNGTITVTKTYDIYTTYCPYPTTVYVNGKGYPVKEPGTLTVSDCPCTVVEELPAGTHAAGNVWPSEQGKPVKPGQTGQGTKPQAPEESVVVITNGAGALELSLGVVAAVGLLAL